jgi:hypothetical protein
VPQPTAELGKRLSGPQWDDLLSYMPLTLHQAVERNFESEYVRMFFNCILHAIAIENVPSVGAFFPRLLSRLTKLGLPVGGAGRSESVPRSFRRTSPSAVPRKRFSDLARQPLGGRVAGHRKPQQLSPLVPETPAAGLTVS